MPKQQIPAVRRPISAYPASNEVAWGTAGVEPGLGDLFNDPLVHLVMRRDGVTLPVLHAVVAAAQAKLRRGLCRGLAA
jgi:hypothetical protein